MNKVLILLVFFLSVVSWGSTVFAEEAEPQSDEIREETEVYTFPEIKPEFYGLAGYRLINLDGSAKAGEFGYLHSSPEFNGRIIAFPFPHRVHLELDFINKNDFIGDARYAYKDLILLRAVSREIFHNLSRVDFEPSIVWGPLQNDAGRKYGLTKTMNNIYLRVKTPDFPLHVFIGGNFIDKEGSQQQRFINDANKIARKRVVDLSSKDIVLGGNSHVGPVEIELSHAIKRLEVNGDKVLLDYYGAWAGRPAGVFPHNFIPEVKGATTTLKLHTSYTGRLVASATFSKMERENADSKAKADYFIAAGDVTYIPHIRLTLFLKYRHRKTDTDNPDTLPANYLGYSVYTAALRGIKPALSSTFDTITGAAKYKPFSRVTLNAEYTHERTERDNSNIWKMPSATSRNSLSLSVNARLIDKLNLKAKYIHQETDAPAYNVQPDSLDEGRVSLSWRPSNHATALLSYDISNGKRDKTIFVDGGLQFFAEDRRMRRDRVLGSLILVCKNLSVTPSYSYIRSRIKQTLVYDNDTNNPVYNIDRDVPYKDTAHTYAVNFDYKPLKNLNLDADISHTQSRADFYPGGLLSAVSGLNIKIEETSYSVKGGYEFKKDWALNMKYHYVNYNDLLNNSNDGTLHSVLFALSRKW